MRSFYLAYKDDKKMQPLAAEISWTKNIIIMSKCKDVLEREFYIKMTKKFGWRNRGQRNRGKAKLISASKIYV